MKLLAAVLLVFILTATPTNVFAQTTRVDGVQFQQRGNQLIITYDLHGRGGHSVALKVSTDGGRTFTIEPGALSGDVGASVVPGANRKVVWDVLRDLPRLRSDALVVAVVPTPDINTKTVGGIEFVFVPGSTFEMGDLWGDGYNDEQPVHTVTVSDFWMSTYEITFVQYDAFCEATGADKPGDAGWGRGNRPVIYVSWNDAVAFCAWLSKKSGETVRLPTEAEWEYAARAGGKRQKWPGTNKEDDLGAYAWYGDNSDGRTHPVGTKKPNALGLYDMAGNAWEWCQDWYDDDYYTRSPQKDPKGPSSGSQRVVRGGSWNYNTRFCRTTFRNRYRPDLRFSFNGFRLVVPVQ